MPAVLHGNIINKICPEFLDQIQELRNIPRAFLRWPYPFLELDTPWAPLWYIVNSNTLNVIPFSFKLIPVNAFFQPAGTSVWLWFTYLVMAYTH